jgi:hypothetical protein
MSEILLEKKYEFELPAGVNIYRLRRPDVSQDSVRRVGSRFGMRASLDASTFLLGPSSVSCSEASGWELRQFRRSGGWQYRHSTRWQADGRGSLKIEDHEAARLALDAIKQHALPTEPELERLRVERLHVAHAARGGANHEERIAGARVLYRRIVDGLPVEGAGGRTIVYLGQESELTGIDHLWRDIESVHEPVRRLRPVDEAIEEVRRRYGAGSGRVEVTDLRLGYFELGWYEDQEYLQPAYVLYLRLFGPDARFRINATVPVAAAVNAVGPIEHVLPARAQQIRRTG